MLYLTLTLSLQYHADPTLRNVKEESPLDLACQYGRLDTVQLLLKTHPNLLIGNTKDHNPLQLASRNGHKAVVQILLEAGCDIDRVVSTLALVNDVSTQTLLVPSYSPLITSIVRPFLIRIPPTVYT